MMPKTVAYPSFKPTLEGLTLMKPNILWWIQGHHPFIWIKLSMKGNFITENRIDSTVVSVKLVRLAHYLLLNLSTLLKFYIKRYLNKIARLIRIDLIGSLFLCHFSNTRDGIKFSFISIGEMESHQIALLINTGLQIANTFFKCDRILANGYCRKQEGTSDGRWSQFECNGQVLLFSTGSAYLINILTG